MRMMNVYDDDDDDDDDFVEPLLLLSNLVSCRIAPFEVL
tara:strand:- start:642 stop:758 length:117 start_codon:yes stop_codon:yes gene_type:complete